jgi:hypothetical protein
MYHSKNRGKGRTSWYDETLNDTRQYQLNIENGIRQAGWKTDDLMSGTSRL